MTNIYKKIKINWTYPIQPTSLQVGTVKIYRGTSEFTSNNVLSQTELVTRSYDPSFTEFLDDFELQEDTTYYYMIIVYGDIDSTISAATGLYSIKIEAPEQEPSWDIKYKVNGQWVYEVTGQVVEVSDSRNSQYRQLATELVVSDRVTEIGYLAFRYWKSLVSVDLGNTVRSISNYAFEFCTGLKSIVFSNSLEVVGDNSFGDCHSLEVLDFGENLQTIKPWALVNLYKLHTIVFRSDPPVTFGDNVFGNGSSGGTKPQYVYVPDHLVDEYYDILKFRILSVSIDRNNCRPLSQYNG